MKLATTQSAARTRIPFEAQRAWRPSVCGGDIHSSDMHNSNRPVRGAWPMIHASSA